MSQLSGFFTRNWTLKASAFGIALLLWFMLRLEAPDRQEVTGIPLRVALNDPAWTLAEEPAPRTVTVRFTGPSGELARIRADRPTLVVPVESVGGADTAIFLRTQWLRVQDRPGVGVEDIQPPTVRLVFEPMERVGLPPAPRLEGTLANGLALSGPPEPATNEIRVAGPRSRVLGLDSVPLHPIDLSRIQGTVTASAAVDTAGLGGLQVSPLAVDVTVRVEPRIQRLLPGVQVSLEDPRLAEEFEEVPETLSVRLSGAAALVNAMDPDGLRLVLHVDAEDLPEPGEEGDFALSLHGLPALVDGEPDPEEVTLRRRPDGDPTRDPSAPIPSPQPDTTR